MTADEEKTRCDVTLPGSIVNSLVFTSKYIFAVNVYLRIDRGRGSRINLLLLIH